MASLEREVRTLHRLADELLATVLVTDDLDIKFQRLIAETALLRLFYSLESAIVNISHKLLLNTAYCDVPASRPSLLRPPFRSASSAEAAVIAARGRRVRYVKWSTLNDIQGNLSNFLQPTEYFLVERQNLDPVFEDLRRVRNHIAHGTRSTQAGFSAVVNGVYPLSPKGISPGKFLLSKRLAFTGASGHGRQRVIEQYLRWAKVAVKTLVKA